MPTTRFKNTLYRLALPFRAPRLERNPKLMVIGAPLRAENDYVRLLRKHHVMGSASLLKDEFNQVILLSSSQNPPHAVREDSLFRVASITKMAAALAVMVAVSQGKLSLGTPVLAYFQDVEDVLELEGVTLAHLLSHTSGLMDPAGLEEALLVGKPFPEIIRGCRISPPGASFHYSNTSCLSSL